MEKVTARLEYLQQTGTNLEQAFKDKADLTLMDKEEIDQKIADMVKATDEII